MEGTSNCFKPGMKSLTRKVRKNAGKEEVIDSVSKNPAKSRGNGPRA